MRAISTFSLECGTSTFWCRALMALRTRVKKSETGSVKLMLYISSNRRSLAFARTLRASASSTLGKEPAATDYPTTFRQSLPYQLDFMTPGISPFRARPRKHRRQIPNLRRKARGRPQIWQRLCCRTGNLGFLFALAILDVFAIVSFTLFAFRYSLFASCYPLTTGNWLLPKRHAHMLQQGPRLVVGARRGHNRNVHALQLFDLGVIDLRKDQLVAHAQREIAAPVEGLGRHSAEVANPRQRHVHQAVEKFVHAVAAQRNHHADGHPFAHLEGRDGLARPRNHRLLPSDLANFAHRRIDQLGVLRRLAHSHVDDDLLQLGSRHGIVEVELFHERRQYILVIAVTHTGGLAIGRFGPRRFARRRLRYFGLRRLRLLALWLALRFSFCPRRLRFRFLLVCHFLLPFSRFRFVTATGS